MVFQIRRTNSNESTIYTGCYGTAEEAIKAFCMSQYFEQPLDITVKDGVWHNPTRYYFKIKSGWFST